MTEVAHSGRAGRAKYPLYEMWIEGKKEYLSLGRAGSAYNNGFVAVEIGEWVLYAEGRTRRMTDDDRAAISDMADDISDSK